MSCGPRVSERHLEVEHLLDLHARDGRHAVEELHPNHALALGELATLPEREPERRPFPRRASASRRSPRRREARRFPQNEPPAEKEVMVLANRSMPSCTVIPVLGYEDVGEAVEW